MTREAEEARKQRMLRIFSQLLSMRRRDEPSIMRQSLRLSLLPPGAIRSIRCIRASSAFHSS
jgi:hypothetical protein